MRKSVKLGRFIKLIGVLTLSSVLFLSQSGQAGLLPVLAASGVPLHFEDIQEPSLLPQTQGPQQVWQDVDEGNLQQRGLVGTRFIVPLKYRVVSVDLNVLDAHLAQAPMEDSAVARNTITTLPLPLPNGETQLFRIEEYALMDPILAQKFPQIKTYLGWGIDDPTATVRLDRTAAGFHGMILSASGISYIDPYSSHDATHYLSYYRRDYNNIWNKQFAESALENGDVDWAKLRTPWAEEAQRKAASTPADTGPIRRTYRLAVATTGEYTKFQTDRGSTAQAAIVTTINRVSGIYEREVSVRMQLIDNTAIIYTDANTDPYTNNSGGFMLSQNQSNLDTVIGNGNYDIGHVFSTGGGGIAGLGVVCATGAKARGVTGSSSPIGDSFDVDFVAHEIGHQFAAEHTFNAAGTTNTSCTNGTRSADYAYEPGGGTTIMAYAGICGNQDLQSNSDDYFHATSLDQIAAFVSNPSTGGSCAASAATGNLAPVVEAGNNYTIPKQTPFTLAGSATDTSGQALTYNWEQLDLGSAWNSSTNPTLPNTDVDAPRPIFRSISPSVNSSRTFPALANILDGTYQNLGESLPTRNRTMKFSLTARDQLGGTANDMAQITVDSGAGPFRVTEPSATTIWPLGTTQSVQWDVANTNAGSVNCTNVNILLSSDGGQTFPTTLATSTPNDGSETITTPNIGSTNLRVKVICASNIFFDISTTGAIAGNVVLNDDHEGTDNWTTITDVGTNNWVRQTGNSYSGNTHWFVADISTETDSSLQSPIINVTVNNLLLRFFHRYDLEAQTNGNTGYDGGILEINVNGSGWTYIDNSRFNQNGYNKTMAGTTPAIGGQQAFSGNSGPNYQESIVNLDPLVNVGDSFQIRFRQVNDSTQAQTGWFVDDVTIYSTQASPTVNLAVTKTASASRVEPGDILTYTLVTKNTGSLVATNIIVTDTLPLSTTLVNNGSNTGSTLLLPGADTLITWNTGISLALNQAITHTLIVAVDTGYTAAQLTNTAYASASNASHNFTSNTVQTKVASDVLYLPIVNR